MQYNRIMAAALAAGLAGAVCAQTSAPVPAKGAAVRQAAPARTLPARQPTPAPTAAAPAESYDWDWLNVAVGAKIGTLGIGGDLTLGVNEYLNLRGGGSWASLSISRKIQDVDYDLDLDLTTFPILLDVHPFANNFRVSGGMILHSQAKAKLKATPDKEVTIGDHKYPAAAVGTLSGAIESARQVAPYIGIGYGNAVGSDACLSFIFDLGVAFQTYDVALTADGPAMAFPEFREDLQKEQEKIQDDADSFKIYPVLAFGIAYYF